MIKPLRSQSEKIKYRPNTTISGGSGNPNPKTSPKNVIPISQIKKSTYHEILLNV